jgi:hypothetical protein
MHPRGQRRARCLTFANSPNQAWPRRYRAGFFQTTSLAALRALKYRESHPPCRSVARASIPVMGRTGSQKGRTASKAIVSDSCTESDPLERHPHPVPQTTTAFPVSTVSRQRMYRPVRHHALGRAVLLGPAILRYHHHYQANKHCLLPLKKLFPYHHVLQGKTTALSHSRLHVT